MGSIGAPVGDVNLFGSKEAIWGPPLVMSLFLDQRRLVGALPLGDVTLLGSKEVSWGPPISDVTLF